MLSFCGDSKLYVLTISEPFQMCIETCKSVKHKELYVQYAASNMQNLLELGRHKGGAWFVQYTGAVQLPDLGWSLQCEMCKCAQCRQCAICADKALSLCPIVEPGLCSVHVVQCAIVVQCAPICHNMQQSCHVVQVQSSDLLIAGQRARPTSHPNASPHSHDGSPFHKC